MPLTFEIIAFETAFNHEYVRFIQSLHLLEHKAVLRHVTRIVAPSSSLSPFLRALNLTKDLFSVPSPGHHERQRDFDLAIHCPHEHEPIVHQFIEVNFLHPFVIRKRLVVQLAASASPGGVH